MLIFLSFVVFCSISTKAADSPPVLGGVSRMPGRDAHGVDRFRRHEQGETARARIIEATTATSFTERKRTAQLMRRSIPAQGLLVSRTWADDEGSKKRGVELVAGPPGDPGPPGISPKSREPPGIKPLALIAISLLCNCCLTGVGFGFFHIRLRTRVVNNSEALGINDGTVDELLTKMLTHRTPEGGTKAGINMVDNGQGAGDVVRDKIQSKNS
mmetsp:Transcript_103193/g.291390  ORF Transcript_103193/g.291390 Transcript_103193/m.291390 type:complete len:214 (+) Transcript_103193:143-784(+)